VPNPTTYASARQYIGLAVETTAGTPVVPVVTVPVEKFDPHDVPTWLDDKALRGSMTEPHNRVQGVVHSEWDMSGPAYMDTLPYLLSNIFGDVVYSGTYTGSGTTTLSTGTAPGAVSVATVATIPSGTWIQIDTGTSSETRLTTGVSGVGPFTLTFTGGLNLAHLAAAVVKPITAPYSEAFAVNNTGNAQPSTLTITDYQGPTPTTGTRAYAGCCLSELNLTGNPESSTIMYTAKGLGWLSASAAAFVSAPSNKLPQPAWETQLGLAGTVGSAPVKTINDYAINIKRELKPYFTAQNSQNPWTIFRGKLTVTGKLNFVAADETPLTYQNSNTQPQLQIIVSNGLLTSNTLAVQFDIQNAAWTTSKISRGNPAVEYAVEFAAIATTTNAGWTGGYSPITVTTSNAVLPLTF
jgi:hypothetical protein